MTKKEAVEYIKMFHGYDLPIQEAFDMAIESLESEVLPVVRGKWMEDSEGEIYCSKCGKHTYDRHDEVIEFNGTTIIAYSYPHYCGNCGADMRGDDGED